MKKETILKWQLFIGVSISYLIIIITTLYLFNIFTDKVTAIRNTTEVTENEIRTIIDIDKKIMAAPKYIGHNQSYTKIMTEVLSNLDEFRRSYSENQKIRTQIDSLKISIEQLLNVSSSTQQQSHISEETFTSLLSINDQITSLRFDLAAERNISTAKLYSSLNDLKTIAYFTIGVPLLFLLFIFNRILKVMKELGYRSKQTHELNKEIKDVQKDIEIANWILKESALLNDAINGQDNEDRIAQISFDHINNALNFHAGSFYIKKAESKEYHLKKAIGIDPSHKPLSLFIEGESLLGKVCTDQDVHIIDSNTNDNLSSSTSLTRNTINKIIIYPLVNENKTYGVLEIGGNYATEDLDRITRYLRRVTRTMAMTIKFAQNHTLVERLLEETQQQTEELEAQQEELRITNEELIYKTNLLETSEEELRVQQEELHNSNEELKEKAEQLESRNIELRNAQKVVEEKIQEVKLESKYKSEFLANMSHELRTPLNSILILARLLKDNKVNNLTKEQIKYASVIYSAGEDLLQLINELLDLAKIESGKVELNYENIQLKNFVRNLESLFTPTAEEKQIDFRSLINSSAPETFLCDEHRLEQVLKNFLSNALKFTNTNGIVTLEVKADIDNIKFIVEDNGKGISPEKQLLIFDAFRQEDGSTSRKYGGTGLGLSISKEIASLLGGRITLKSTLGEGSTFTLIIPNTQKQIPEGNNKKIDLETQVISNSLIKDSPIVIEGDKSIFSDRHLLIIEDDIKFADILKDFAEQYGFTVSIANDGAEGIKKAQEEKPDAIILDVMLPISDGWEVLHSLKENKKTQHIPIHMMSAADFKQKDFIEQGAIGFLSKPITEETLKKAFENINLNIDKGVKKILLVEDQEFQSEIIKNAFAEQNINVLQAFSAQSALDKLTHENNIDCIILDIKLPDEDGLDTLDKIKALPKHQETPIIINTAYDLSKEQIDRIAQHTKAMVLKSSKSNSRLIDEATLFLNKISSQGYSPIKNIKKLAPATNSKDSLSGKKVLVADDDMRNIFALTTALQSLGMHVEIANNGQEALKIIEDPGNKIEIVLMDIMMPEMDGYEAIYEIRKNKKNAQLPIIAVTAKAMKGDREKSIKMGANDYISKPIDIDKLISLLRVWLS